MYVYRGASCVNLEKVTHFQLDFNSRRKRKDDAMIKFYFDHFYEKGEDGDEQKYTVFFFDTVKNANNALLIICSCIEQGKSICFLNNEDIK